MVRPWDDAMFDGGDHEDEIEELYKECQASEFYFQLDDQDGDQLQIFITPADYYDREGYAFDQSLQIEHLLPTDFNELAEGIYATSRPWEIVQAELLGRGFRAIPEPIA